mmetsp:Transcript_19739/g.41959  ORF Transcript_19739/g.41959 Transcript_19739/m.41959 type:complete len:323 (+) Transcript_19739:815-1783(+)
MSTRRRFDGVVQSILLVLTFGSLREDRYHRVSVITRKEIFEPVEVKFEKIILPVVCTIRPLLGIVCPNPLAIYGFCSRYIHLVRDKVFTEAITCFNFVNAHRLARKKGSPSKNTMSMSLPILIELPHFFLREECTIEMKSSQKEHEIRVILIESRRIWNHSCTLFTPLQNQLTDSITRPHSLHGIRDVEILLAILSKRLFLIGRHQDEYTHTMTLVPAKELNGVVSIWHMWDVVHSPFVISYAINGMNGICGYGGQIRASEAREKSSYQVNLVLVSVANNDEMTRAGSGKLDTSEVFHILKLCHGQLLLLRRAVWAGSVDVE